jgi:hypothetical protein
MRGGGWTWLAAVVVLLVAGCGPDGDDEGGFGVPTQPADAPLAGTRVPITGTVQVERNGCLMLDTGTGRPRWIVWPADQEDDQGQPVLEGRLVVDGDVLSGTGAELTADALPDWANRDSYFGSFGTFCSAEETGIVVLDDVARG